MPLTDADDMWTQVTLSLRSQLAESVWFSTFQEVTPISVDDHTFRLLAPSAYVRDRITTRYMPMIVDALDESGVGGRTITIDVDQAPERESMDRADSAPVERIALHYDDGPSQAGSRATGLGKVGPPDLALGDHHELRSRTRRAALDTNSSSPSPTSAQVRSMASVTWSGAWRATYSATAWQ